MRLSFRRSRTAPREAAVPGATDWPATPAGQIAPAGYVSPGGHGAQARGGGEAAHGWTALPPLRAVVSSQPPAVGAPVLRLPDVAGARVLLDRPRPFAVPAPPPPVGRVQGLTVPRDYAEAPTGVAEDGPGTDPPGAGSSAVAESAPGNERARGTVPARLLHPARRPADATGPLTVASDEYVGPPQVAAEPYRAPRWLRATPPAMPAPAAQAPAIPEVREDGGVPDWLKGPGPVLASWTSPARLPAQLAQVAEAGEDAAPSGTAGTVSPSTASGHRRRANLGESRRLGLGAPFSRPPGESFTPPRATEPAASSDRQGPPPAPAGALVPVPGGEPEPGPAAVAAALYRAAVQGAPAPPALRHVNRVEPVPGEVAGAFRSAYGADVSRVPVLRGPRVAAEARQRGSRAFARGGAVYLPDEEGPLHAAPGRSVLSHELMHVLQQRALGRSLPDERSAHGLALEAQARRAESLLGGSVSAPPALTHPPAAPGPDHYAQQITEELLRQGLAHTDASGTVHLGPEHVDQADAAAAAQHLRELSELTRAEFEEIKIKAYNEAHGTRYASLTDSEAVRDQLSDLLKFEVDRWMDGSDAQRRDRGWLIDAKLAAITEDRSSRHEANSLVADLTDLPSKQRQDIGTEVDAQLRLLASYLSGEGEGEQGFARSAVPRVPKGLIGMQQAEAEAELAAQQFTNVAVDVRESLEPEGLVIEVTPAPGSIVGGKDERVSLIVSAGVSAAAIARELRRGAESSALGFFGLSSKDAKSLAGRLGGWLGLSGADADDQAAGTDGSAPEGEETALPPRAPSGRQAQPEAEAPGEEAETREEEAQEEEAPAEEAETPGEPASAATGAAVATVAGATRARQGLRSAPGAQPRLERLLMPNVVGKDYREASAELVDKMRLTISVRYQESLEPAGLVIFTEPGPKTPVGFKISGADGPPEQTAEVVLVVSSGVAGGPGAVVRAAGAETLMGLRDSLLSTFGFGMSGAEKQEYLASFVRTTDEELVAPESRQEDTGAAPGLPDAGAAAAGAPRALTPPGTFTAEGTELNDLVDRLYPLLHTRISQDLKIGRQRIGRAMDQF